MTDGTTTERQLAEAIRTLREIANGYEEARAFALEALERIDQESTEDIRILNGTDMYAKYILPKNGDGKIYVMVRTVNRTRRDGEMELLRDILDSTALQIEMQIN